MNGLKLKLNQDHGKKILIVLGLCLMVWIWREPLAEMLSMIGDRDAIVEYIHGFGPWGPIILTLILGVQVFLAFIPGHAFIVAGGYVYGFLIGTLITQAATVVASQLAYLLARKYGRPFVNRVVPENITDRWNGLAERQGGIFFFFAFILPIFPNDFMSFIAGLSSITPRNFFWANFFGRLPCAIFITLIGSHGFELPLQFWAAIILIVVGLCVFWKKISAGLDHFFLKRQGAAAC